jgi:hypothetical protein
MGHIRLGTLPRTRKWIQVLDLIGDGAATPEVAAATMDALQRGLVKAAKDPGLVHAGPAVSRPVHSGIAPWRFTRFRNMLAVRELRASTSSGSVQNDLCAGLPTAALIARADEGAIP